MKDPKRARFLLALTFAILMADPVSAHLALPSASHVPGGASSGASSAPLAPATAPLAIPATDSSFHDGRSFFGRAPALTPIAPQAFSAAPPAGIQTVCPQTSTQQTVNQAQGTAQDGDSTVYGCPFRVHDSKGLFGNGQIAVRDGDEQQMAFFSLHGDPANGPTNRSRSGLTHAAFTTGNQGINWEDQPTQYGGGGSGLAWLGESASGTMDSQGQLYAAYLWSLPNGNATTGYAGLIGLYKGQGTAADSGAMTRAHSSGKFIRGQLTTDIIPQLDIIDILPRIPPPPPANLTLDENATVAPPASQQDIGKEARPMNRSQERIAAVWFEKAVDYTNPSLKSGYAGWIDGAIATTQLKSDWMRLRMDRNHTNEQVIGPCMDASNPVSWNGFIYVVCEVDNGYNHRSRARIGDLDMWAIDPLTGNSTIVSFTGLRGGHPKLAVTPDGYFALVSETDHGRHLPMTLDGTFGFYGIQWSRSEDMGPELHRIAGNHDTYDLHLNAIAISPTEKTVAFVYMEWQRNRTAEAPDPNKPVVVDPQNPTPPAPRLLDYQKFIVTTNECEFPRAIAASLVELGSGLDPRQTDAYQKDAKMFDDHQDGLVANTWSNGDEMFTFAINDYGAMQVAAVKAISASAPCDVSNPPIVVQAAAPPQALSLTNPALTVTSAAVGTGAVAMVAYLLTVKRRVAHIAVTEAK